jgi:hypothetical protein
LLTGGRETFGRDGGGHHSHCAQVHDTDYKEDHRQAGTAVGTVETEAQTVPPSHFDICRQRIAVPWCHSTTGQVMRLPCGELECSGDQDNHTRCDRSGAR